MSLAVPLAAAAAVLTLICSASLLNSSPALDVRHSINEGEPLQPGTRQLKEYMSSATAAHENPAVPVEQPVQDPPKPVQGADASPPSTAPPLAAIGEAEYDGHFLYARPEATPNTDATHLRTLLKSMLGMGVLLKRTVVLPAALCNCRDAELTQCDGPPVPPFDCPIRIPLDPEAWRLTKLVAIKPARFLIRKDLPEVVRCNHLRVLLPDGAPRMDEETGATTYTQALHPCTLSRCHLSLPPACSACLQAWMTPSLALRCAPTPAPAGSRSRPRTRRFADGTRACRATRSACRTSPRPQTGCWRLALRRRACQCTCARTTAAGRARSYSSQTSAATPSTSSPRSGRSCQPT